MKKNKLVWNVFTWDINSDSLVYFDVIPVLMQEYKKLRKKDRPKTRAELDRFLKNESIYHFWSKCEYEILIGSWPESDTREKIDVFAQLQLNWDLFVDTFWSAVSDELGFVRRYTK